VKKTLTVQIMTKNEESKIRRCLESVKWADEIVIVDGYSTDGTIDICRQYNAKIIQHKFDGSFDTDCNIGIENASCDWILKIDADEVVADSLRKDIESVLEDDRGFSAFKFRRKNFFLGHFMRYGGWYHYILSLFKKGKAYYKGSIHETLVVNGKVGQIEGDCEHYPFNSISEFMERHNRYSTIEAQKILDNRGILDMKVINYNLKIKPLKRFWKFYIKKQGFREGVHGFIFSILFAWVHFLNWAKYWEMVKERINDSSERNV